MLENDSATNDMVEIRMVAIMTADTTRAPRDDCGSSSSRLTRTRAHRSPRAVSCVKSDSGNAA